jgi:hypothetical protein
MKHRIMVAGAMSLVLAGCTGPGACTLNIEPGITVQALEAATGRNVTDSASGTVTEGTYSDSLRPFGVDTAGRVLRLSAADERSGTYDVFVERPGYQSVSLSNIRVTRDECHVHTAALDVTMVPIP